MSETTVDNYGWSGNEPPHSCTYLAPTILQLVAESGANSVIDLGCGNGSLCASLKGEMGLSVVGMDQDAQAIAIASSAHKGIAFYHQGLGADPAEIVDMHGGRFELAISTEVIEHLYLPDQLLQYAESVLTPNGQLIITTPYHGYAKNLALSLADRWDSHHTSLWDGGHIKFWSRRTLGDLLERNGFSVVRFLGVGRFPYLWKSMVVIAQRSAWSMPA